MTKKWNQLCDTCSRDCKQPPLVTMISCPEFDRADKTLELFDAKGNVKRLAVNPTEKKKKPPKMKISRGRIFLEEE